MLAYLALNENEDINVHFAHINHQCAVYTFLPLFYCHSFQGKFPFILLSHILLSTIIISIFFLLSPQYYFFFFFFIFS